MSKKNIPSDGPADKKQMPPARDSRLIIVGIGASAGGLKALEQFFSSIPAQKIWPLDMAFVIVAHLDPDHASLLPDLLQKKTQMEVFQVQDGMQVKPHSVYIIPPNKDMAILHGTLQLMEPVKSVHTRLPIDYFFRSLAEDQGESAVGIILSGMGTDGTLGIRNIKGNLGMVMVQQPESTSYDGMPQSAIKTGLVDYVLLPEEMPEQLHQYTEKLVLHYTGPKREAESPDALQKIFVILRSATGSDFSMYKKNTVLRRIQRRMTVHQIENIFDYVRYLRENPEETSALFKELVIGVTNFFRDREAWSVLEKLLFDILKEKQEGYIYRVWVPGCSSGEEAYTAAILIKEILQKLERSMEVQIFGTDIDEDAINYARIGTYPASIASDIDEKLLKKYFSRQDASFRINGDIRDMLVFAVQDLTKDPPFTKLDMLICRNLLIYLEQQTQNRILPIFAYSLKERGFLFLGSSETTGQHQRLFMMENKKWKIYSRLSEDETGDLHLEFPTTTPIERFYTPDRRRQIYLEDRLEENIKKGLLDRFAPPCVVVDRDGNIIYIHGRTGKYLEPASGKASMNILEMAREGLKLEISSVLRHVFAEGKETTLEKLKVEGNGGHTYVDLTVRPFGSLDAHQAHYIVIFNEVQKPDKEEIEKRDEKYPDKSNQHVAKLENELQLTRENLQTTIEELETSNEELKSTNEELQSTNEELQSSNEELESSKEELQSLNEELVTVNSELNGKVVELSRVNDDMSNLFNSIEVPLIFLNTELCIERFTEQIKSLINLREGDIGRPLLEISTNLKFDDLIKDARQVLKTMMYKETEVETNDGRWYRVRIIPYRTEDNVINGLVITFFDISGRKEAKLCTDENIDLKRTRDFFEKIIDTIKEPLLILGQNQEVISANRSFYSFFDVEPDDTVGRHVYELGDGQWDIPRLRELLGKIIPRDSVFENYKVEHEFPGIGLRKILLNARKISGSREREEMILLAFEDCTPEGDQNT